MGSTNGKYNIKSENSVETRRTTLPILLPNSKKSKKEKLSLPRFIHHASLTDLLLSTKDNLTLVWFDTEINQQPMNIDIQIQLKNLINSLRIFDEINAFEKYIEQIHKMNKEKLLIIISPTLSLTIIPSLHNLSQIKYIYIYGKAKIDPNIHQDLIKQYPKVKGIFSKCRCLFSQITEDKKLE